MAQVRAATALMPRATRPLLADIWSTAPAVGSTVTMRWSTALGASRQAPMVRISYMSIVRGDFSGATNSIESISERAAEVNRSLGITGLLSYDAKLQQVWQVLEGEKKDVMAVWENIQRDGRHVIDEASISIEDVSGRAFPSEWGMKLRIRGI
mmetsp:Transcript_2242/g.1786  ORF Transcript_2242/g.1786 Transcript_2242/m.1786 type:complete len:153 (-) Transcript_2242:166-624(-)